MRFLIPLLFLLMSSTDAFCQQQMERLSLKEAVAKALEKNFDIHSVTILSQEATANNTLGNAGLLPNINGTGGVNTALTNAHIEFADGRNQSTNNASSYGFNAGLLATFTVYAGGKAWLIKKQLNIKEQYAKDQLKAQIQAAVSQTIQAYAKVVWQQQQNIAIDTAIDLAKTRMNISKMKYDNGSAAKVDYLQALVDYNARRSDSLNQIAALSAAFSDLNLLIGQDAYTSYLIDDSVALDLSLQPKDKDLLLGANLSIALAKGNLDIANMNAKIVKKSLLPTLGVSTGYSYNRTQSQSGTFLFNQGYGPTSALNLSVPIFQGGVLHTQTKVAKLEAMRQEILLDKQSTDIARQYRSVWDSYETAVASYRLQLENIGFAKENLDIQKVRFRVGLATTIETREAENSYVQALISLYTAAYNVKINETKVLELESDLVQ